MGNWLFSLGFAIHLSSGLEVIFTRFYLWTCSAQLKNDQLVFFFLPFYVLMLFGQGRTSENSFIKSGGSHFRKVLFQITGSCDLS